MNCVAHISDLHFGTEDPVIAEALLHQLADEEPALVIVSGDLTQRARVSQFKAARQYLDQIKAPLLVIPGNHDVPLYDIVRRSLSPLGRYRRWINHDLNPHFESSELIVAGINTARSLTWKNGRISEYQIEHLRSILEGRSTEKFKVVVTHHPFIPPPGDPGIELVGRAAIALPVLDQCGVDLLLAGHLHHGYTGDVRTYHPAARRSIIVAQAGTAISRRIRTEPNAYNLLRLDRNTISIEVRLWTGSRFTAHRQANYKLKDAEWCLQTTSSEK